MSSPKHLTASPSPQPSPEGEGASTLRRHGSCVGHGLYREGPGANVFSKTLNGVAPHPSPLPKGEGASTLLRHGSGAGRGLYHSLAGVSASSEHTAGDIAAIPGALVLDGADGFVGSRLGFFQGSPQRGDVEHAAAVGDHAAVAACYRV